MADTPEDAETHASEDAETHVETVASEDPPPQVIAERRFWGPFDRTKPLGLPDGSVTALLALVIVGVDLYCNVKQLTVASLDQLTQGIAVAYVVQKATQFGVNTNTSTNGGKK